MYKVKQTTSNKIQTPFGTMNFLNELTDEFMESGSSKFVNFDEESIMDINSGFIHTALQWRVFYLLDVSSKELLSKLSEGSAWNAWNDTQVFFIQDLCKSYFHFLTFQKFRETINQLQNESLRTVLSRLCSLYALDKIVNDLSFFYEGSFFTSSEIPIKCKSVVMQLCSLLKNESVSLVDSFALPDCALPSILARSGGNVYDDLFDATIKAKGSTDRPSYWKECATPVENAPSSTKKFISKL